MTLIFIVTGFSLITNEVIGDIDSNKTPPTHHEVMATADQRGRDMQKLVAALAKKLKDQHNR